MARSTKADVEVRIFGNVNDFARAMNKAKWETMSFQKKLLATSGIMKNWGKSMTMGVTVPIVAGLGLATKAAIDEQKEMALLSKALKNNAKATDEQVASVEDWITATQNATGIADGELRPAFSNLVRVTKDVSQAQSLMQTAMDISVAKGKPLETVTLAMAKAYNGQVGALGRLGLSVNDANGKTVDFATAMERANDAFGGSAATAAETTAGKIAILKAKMADLGEQIGTILIPWVEKGVSVVSRLADKFQSMPGWMQKGIVAFGLFAAAVGPVLWMTGQLVQTINTINTVIKGIKTAGFLSKMGSMGDAVGGLNKKLLSMIRNVLPQLNTLLAASAVQWGLVGVAAAAAAVAIWQAYDAAKQYRDAQEQADEYNQDAIRNLEKLIAKYERLGRDTTALKKQLADLKSGYKHVDTPWWYYLNPAYPFIEGASKMASGGYVPARSGGTPIIAGEGGEGEYVIPESKMGGGATFTNCTFSAHSPSEVRDQVLRALRQASAMGY